MKKRKETQINETKIKVQNSKADSEQEIYKRKLNTSFGLVRESLTR